MGCGCTYFWGLLALIALAVTLLLLSIGTFYARRLEAEPKLPISEEIGAAPRVIKKLRKRETMTREEFEYAERIVAIRGNPMAFCIPLTLFAMSTYYIFACLEYLQGATPSERHFIGVIPMITSIKPRHSAAARKATQGSSADRASGGLRPSCTRCRARWMVITFRKL